MKRKLMCILCVIAFSGCNKVNQLTTITCLDSVGVGIAKSLIADEAQKLLSKQKKSGGTQIFDEAAVRATMSKLQISFDDIRTSKTDPNSTKVFCDATYKISVPSDLYQAVNEGIMLVDSDSNIDKVASRYGFSTSANIFTREISYSLQPTDDRKSVFAATSDGENPSNFLGIIIAYALEKSTLEARRADEKRAEDEAGIAARLAASEEAQRQIQFQHEGMDESPSSRQSEESLPAEQDEVTGDELISDAFSKY